MGWTNDQSTTLDGQAFLYTNTTTTYSTGSTLVVNNGAVLNIAVGSTLTVDGTIAVTSPGDILTDGYSMPRGMRGYIQRVSDGPLTTTTFTQAAAKPTLLVTAPIISGRRYRVIVPNLVVSSQTPGAVIVQLTYTTDGTTPSVTGTRLGWALVDTPGSSVVRSMGTPSNDLTAPLTGTLKVLLSIYSNVLSATTAGADRPLQLVVEDIGVDYGQTGTVY